MTSGKCFEYKWFYMKYIWKYLSKERHQTCECRLILFYCIQVQDLIKDCFVTGEWEKTEDATKRLQQDGNSICYDLLEI